jgi:general L-amino acid transport system permease protein
VLPAIVGQFIILFKDTAVISLLGLLDFLGTANAILSGRRMWFNAEIGMFVFVAAVYRVFTYAMTSVSRAIEKSMSKGVG